MKKAISFAFISLLGLCFSGCFVEGRAEVARPARPACRHAVWVHDGYGRHGRYHHGYWSCGRRVVIVE